MRYPLALMAALIAASTLSAAGSATDIRRVPFGSTFTVSGQTGARPGAGRARGTVLVRGSWNGGVTYVITTTTTDSHGRYRFSLTLRRHGLLKLQVVPPDKHDQYFVLLVR